MRSVGGWGARVLATVGSLVALAACGSVSPSLSTSDPLHDLITIDQLVAPNFTVSSASSHIDAATIAAGDGAIVSTLKRDGMQAAARVEYQRDVNFSTSNGPIDIVATVERFAGISGASSAYGANVRQLDAIPDAVPASTGPLGDEAHSISVVRATPGGLQAVEITVVWRVRNIVNLMVARGRYGGTRTRRCARPLRSADAERVSRLHVAPQAPLSPCAVPSGSAARTAPQPQRPTRP